MPTTGDTTDTSVIWVTGDTVGKNPGGVTVALPRSVTAPASGVASPTGIPEGNTFYFKGPNNVYYHNGSAWTGPFTISGATIL